MASCTWWILLPSSSSASNKASMSPSASSGSSSADGGSCEWCEEHIPQISAAQCRCSTTMHNVAASLPFLKCYGLIIRSWNVAKQNDASWTGGKSKVLDLYLILRSKIIQGSLEAKLPTIWQRREEEKRSKKRKSQRKEAASARKGRRVAKQYVFPMICGCGRSKSRLAKACQMSDEKLHAVVAQSAFRSQNVQSTPFSKHFWKLRWWKSARRCGAKRISKSKC